MKQWYLWFFIFFFIGCDNNEIEQDYQAINIEKNYPYLYERHLVKDVDAKTFELFNQKIFLINSIAQLDENPLLNRCADIHKEEFSKCNFDKYTLIMASSSTLNEVIGMDCRLRYNTIFSCFEYDQTLYSKPLVEPIENILFILNVILVKKIPGNSTVSFTKNITIID